MRTSPDQVAARWDLPVSPELALTELPAGEEIHLLRDGIDKVRLSWLAPDKQTNFN